MKPSGGGEVNASKLSPQYSQPKAGRESAKGTTPHLNRPEQMP